MSSDKFNYQENPLTSDKLNRLSVPKLTTTDRDSMTTGGKFVTGSIIYNITTNRFEYYTGTGWSPINKDSLDPNILYGNVSNTFTLRQTFNQDIELKKQSVSPADPALEDAIIFLKALDANNNAIHAKYKIGGSIVERVLISRPTRNEVEFTTAGSFNWTAPANLAINEIQIILCGAGGGGGSRTAYTSNPAGGGGGGGGVTVGWLKINAGDTITVVVGAGGAGGLYSAGANGGDSYITYNMTNYFHAYGGDGGDISYGGGDGYINLDGTKITNEGGTAYVSPQIHGGSIVGGYIWRTQKAVAWSGAGGGGGSYSGRSATNGGGILYGMALKTDGTVTFQVRNSGIGSVGGGGGGSLFGKGGDGSSTTPQNGSLYGGGGGGSGKSTVAGGNGADGYAKIIYYTW